MSLLDFRCFECGVVGPLKVTAEGRDVVYRMRDDPTQSAKITAYCVSCGAANEIALTTERLAELLTSIRSNDPNIQRTIDDVRSGDFSTAISELRKRFGV